MTRIIRVAGSGRVLLKHQRETMSTNYLNAMNKLTLTIASITVGLLMSCAPDKPKAESESYEDIHGTEESSKNAVAANADPGKGIGQVTNVELKTPLEQERIGRGKAIYDMKCAACHKLNDQRVVGPGWQ